MLFPFIDLMKQESCRRCDCATTWMLQVSNPERGKIIFFQDLTPPSCADVNGGSYTSSPFMCAHGVGRDNFALTFYRSVKYYVFSLNLFDIPVL